MMNKQIHSNNLKVLEDQLNYESLMNKKYTTYASFCTDSQLKGVCTNAATIHKNNFNSLKSYLDSHQ